MERGIDNSIIHVGIDLGTTNSEVATSFGDGVEIVKNSRGEEYTPSIFGVDKNGNNIVGRAAYNKLCTGSVEDIDNIKSEVKRLMGTSERIYFSRNNKDYAPEELSAEILKSLKNDISRKYSDIDIYSAVITVPAYFDSLQNEATKRAGEICGFDYVVLLQEPIAAAFAYGFNSNEDANWLVYDLGGGTFDIALISSRDGIIKVVEHGGDNFLGGKDMDKEIVDKLLVPAINQRYKKSNYSDKTLLAKLKSIAEEVKIQLSTSDSTVVEISNIGDDDNGEEIYVSFEYSRGAFNNLITPIIDKTIKITSDVIERSTISKESISKIILVGGPTQIPYLRQRLESEIGIKVDSSIDPLTTVAKGACIYGLGCRVPSDIIERHRGQKNEQEISVALNYDSMTSDKDEMITGTIDLPDDGQEYRIKICSEDGFYDSNYIAVKNGKFFDNLSLRPNKTNRFTIILVDHLGNNVPVYPNTFSITHGLSTQGAPIPHNVGVIYSEKNFGSGFKFVEVCEQYFGHGDILPLEKTETFKTVRALDMNSINSLPIKIYEGDSSEADHNNIITTMQIMGEDLPHNLPAGTELDVTIKINESREVAVEVFIPSIELSLESERVRVDTYAQELDVDQIKEECGIQAERIGELNISDEEKNSLKNEVKNIQDSISEDDPDSSQKAYRDLVNVAERVNKIESSQEIDVLIKKFKKDIENIKGLLSDIEKDGFRLEGQYSEIVSELEDRGENAISAKDKTMLINIIEQIDSVKIRIMAEIPAFWIMMLDSLEKENINLFSNTREARRHFDEAHRAKDEKNLIDLKEHVGALIGLLPKDVQDQLSNDKSGITK